MAEVLPDLVTGDDGLARCRWGTSAPEYVGYHDTEWGRPVHGEHALFERITLEAFQSGLSWLTILRKRDGFRTAFAGFDPEVVARFDDDDRARLMADAAIVRNRAKVDAAITNARAVLDLRDGPGPGRAVLVVRAGPGHASGAAAVRRRPGHHRRVDRAVEGVEEERVRLRRARPRPTPAMQACGLVDDHLAGCHAARRRRRGGAQGEA